MREREGKGEQNSAKLRTSSAPPMRGHPVRRRGSEKREGNVRKKERQKNGRPTARSLSQHREGLEKKEGGRETERLKGQKWPESRGKKERIFVGMFAL